ncbi:MAG: YbgA family protein [Nitrosopumilus sp.]|nr:YbgA family protein [Nitrosopumilus sp.]
MCKLNDFSKVEEKIELPNSINDPISEKDAVEYVLQRFESVKENGKIKDLVSFHAMNKYMIMAHSQEELKILGNLVASNKKIDYHEILDEYEKHLKNSFESKPTIKKHSNVIMHIFGYFSNSFSQQEKEKFFKMLADFKDEKMTIGEFLSEINPIVYRFNNTYLSSQTYFLLYSNSDPTNLFKILSKKLC